MLGPVILPAQEGGQGGGSGEEASAMDAVHGAIVILDEQIKILTSTVGRIEGDVDNLKTGDGGLVAEADRLAAELKQKRELYRFIEIIVVALVGMLALYVILWFLRKSDEAKRDNNPNHVGLAPQDIMNASGLSLIIFGTILVVIIADTEQQLIASVGILGAVAGYLFRGLHDAGGRDTGPPPNALKARDDNQES